MGVLPKLRETVALKSGMPLHQVDKMTMRQALVVLLLVDYVERGKFDAVDRILDRTDPKSRRVSHDGSIDLRAVATSMLDLDEQRAAEIYKDMLPGGTLEAEVVEE